MRILFVREGLGVQLLYYVFARYMEEVTGIVHYLDISHYSYREVHNGFELDKIFPNIKLNLFKECYDEELYNLVELDLSDVSKRYLALEKLGIKDIHLISTSKRNFLFGDYNYNLRSSGDLFIDKGRETANIENVCYVGWFCDERIFASIKDKLLYELQFQTITDEINKIYLKQIITTISVGVHIRRGDFIMHNWDLPAEKYIPAIKKLRKQITSENEIPYYFIFTNDLEWCQENRCNLGFLPTDNVIFVEGNTTDAKNYIDMQLMSSCKYLVSNNRSTFSKVAGWLNPNLIEHIRITETEKKRAIRLINSNPYEKIVELENTLKSLSDKQDILQNNTLDLENKFLNLQLENKTILEKLDKQANSYNKKLESIVHSKDNEITQLREQLHSAKLEIVRHKEQTVASQKQVSQHKSEIVSYKKEVNKYKGQVRYHKMGKDDIIHSLSYKLGRAITWLPRKVRVFFSK